MAWIRSRRDFKVVVVEVADGGGGGGWAAIGARGTRADIGISAWGKGLFGKDRVGDPYPFIAEYMLLVLEVVLR